MTRQSRKNVPNRSPLAGKLFDTDGRPLTPSHANKAGRRYRYYLLRTEAEDVSWRLPAGELEANIQSALNNSREVRLHRDRHPLQELDLWDSVERVDVHDDQLLIRVVLDDAGVHEICAPFTCRHRGVETKLVLDGGASRDPDLVMVRRVHRAMSWVDEIKSGKTVKEVADAEDVTSCFIRHNIDLAFLSLGNPDRDS